MPKRYIHKKLSGLALGDPCEETHAAIDGPVKELGRGHRKFYHDPVSAGLIGLFENGYKGAISGAMHVLTDKYVDNYIYKEALKFSIKILEHVKNEIEKAERNKLKN